jgi:hypothetical protein
MSSIEKDQNKNVGIQNKKDENECIIKTADRESEKITRF